METLVISSVLLWAISILNFLVTVALARRVNSKQLQNGISLPPAPRLDVGQPAPSFSAEDLNQTTVTLANYAGRSVALIFVSPRCQPCRLKIPELQALQPNAQKAGVELLLVIDSNAGDARSFADELQIRLPVIVAPRQSNPLMEDYLASATPFYCLIDVSGRVASTGYFDGEWQALTRRWGG